MRYEDWDIQLFHGQKPLREFRPQCNTMPETEDSLRVSGVVPIMTCFVPSLPQGTAFEVSVNSWGGEQKFLYPQGGPHGEPMVWCFKLVLDGKASCIHTLTNEDCTWPKSLTYANIDGTDRPLQFPLYHDSVMQPATWDPRDLSGRIRLEISEGYMATTSGGNLNFIKMTHHAIFSFQAAPLYKLEDARIAYPNPFLTANPLPPQGGWPVNAVAIPRPNRIHYRNSSISSTNSTNSGHSRRFSGSTALSGGSRSTSGYSIMSASAMPLIQKIPGSMPPPPLPIHVAKMTGSSPQRRQVSMPPEMLGRFP